MFSGLTYPQLRKLFFIVMDGEQKAIANGRKYLKLMPYNAELVNNQLALILELDDIHSEIFSEMARRNFH